MMRSLWTAASGMIAQQTNVDTISNNIANVNTTGFKAQKAEFKTLLYQNLQTRTTTANGEEKPVPAQVGLGTRVAATNTFFTQGALQASENDTDFAIEGDGFFAVRGEDGEIYYTRNGCFNWSIGVNGTTLCNTNGYPVLDTQGNEIIVPAGVSTGSMVISSDGAVGYTAVDGTYVALNQSIGLHQFTNPAGLEKLSNSLFAVTDASGAAMNEATTANLIRSKVYQGYLEGSNVQIADEMVNLIVAQRAYELNSKAIQASDEMLQQANQLRR
ncbi:MAG: flagellar basal-body rod protein FlgG [Lachnospiraceae bacterium]|nr:flagellar basal-body rod protein FlgG [Lachnospiraceae bacterium]